MGLIKTITRSIAKQTIGDTVVDIATKAFNEFTKSKCVYNVRLRGNTYCWRVYIIPKITHCSHRVLCAGVDDENRNDPYADDRIEYCELIHFHGIPIWIRNVAVTSEHNTDYELYLTTINHPVAIDALHKFITTARKFITKARGDDDVFSVQRLQSNGGARLTTLRHPRSMDEIFIPSATRAILLKTVDRFQAQHDWYIEHGIPYHLGIMLYGSAGTGKSTIAMALANYVGDIITAVDPTYLDKLSTADMLRANPCVVLVEDIDCTNITHDRTKQQQDSLLTIEPTVNLATILNAIDGVGAEESAIYIFTTNHLEQLDAALIRPGRIDLCLEIGYACVETLNDFCKSFYDKEIPEMETFEIKDGLTFAELQVDVMRGMPMEELLEKCRKDPL